MNSTEIQHLIEQHTSDTDLRGIANKVLNGERINDRDCLVLYEKAELGFVGMLADYVRKQKTGDVVYFNKNIHIEPSNICIHNCKFCSYSKPQGDPQCWELSIEQMLAQVSETNENSITEVHIVGGVHPERGVDFYCELLSGIKELRPAIQIKAFTAVEIDYMAQKSKISFAEVFSKLKAAGLDAMPGGGAEILDDTLRQNICSSKSNSATWLAIHQAAHENGIPTNATMLYGHIETFAQRVAHMSKLRSLQDKTQGFNAFIPLKYRKENNDLALTEELPYIEDLRNFAIARLYLDNIAHIKAYWVMLGKELAQISLDFGVNDFDGTINDSTKIYSMAGAEETNPTLTETEMIALIHNAQRTAVERNSLYTHIKTYPQCN
ncbi:MAG: aminofutalosine synthase MqnE [Bacteroidales bacterium]|jgi:aminodeoxyfutalosine synthase|nr:aminofutalosine synthase MqnE [Bacteroidales bacterium]